MRKHQPVKAFVNYVAAYRSGTHNNDVSLLSQLCSFAIPEVREYCISLMSLSDSHRIKETGVTLSPESDMTPADLEKLCERAVQLQPTNLIAVTRVSWKSMMAIY